MRKFILILLYFFMAAGCAAPKMTYREPVDTISATEGIAFGSVLISAFIPSDNASLPPAGSVIPLKETEWNLSVASLATTEGFSQSTAESVRSFRVVEGREAFFLLRLTAGDYVVLDLRTAQGDRAAAPAVRLRKPFKVSQGKATYVGRMVVQIPDKVGQEQFRLGDLRSGIRIEKDQAGAYAALKGGSGNRLDDAVEGLMGDYAACQIPPGSLASESFQKETLGAVWVMESDTDNTCKRRNLTKIEVIGSLERSGGEKRRTERWTVDRCGRPIYYRIEFITSVNGELEIVVPEGSETP